MRAALITMVIGSPLRAVSSSSTLLHPSDHRRRGALLATADFGERRARSGRGFPSTPPILEICARCCCDGLPLALPGLRVVGFSDGDKGFWRFSACGSRRQADKRVMVHRPEDSLLVNSRSHTLNRAGPST